MIFIMHSPVSNLRMKKHLSLLIYLQKLYGHRIKTELKPIILDGENVLDMKELGLKEYINDYH